MKSVFLFWSLGVFGLCIALSNAWSHDIAGMLVAFGASLIILFIGSAGFAIETQGLWEKRDKE